MRISYISEGHWAIVPNYPNSLVKKKPKKGSLSFIVDTDSVERFSKNMKLKEDRDLDDISYGKPKEDLQYKDAPTPLLGHKWRDLKIGPPPKNSSSITHDELKSIVSSIKSLVKGRHPNKNKEIEEQDVDDLEMSFVKLLRELGEDVSDRLVKILTDLTEECTTVGIYFKELYNRARPYQLANAYGINIDFPHGNTTSSPSYPSTHAIVGKVLAVLLAKVYPKHKEAILKLGYDLGMNRVIAGFHFLSDFKAGREIGSKLLSDLESNGNGQIYDMKLHKISESQYKDVTTNMARYNLGNQYGTIDYNDTIHDFNDHIPNPIERDRQMKLRKMYQNVRQKRKRRYPSR